MEWLNEDVYTMALYMVGSFIVVIFALNYFNAPPGFVPQEKGVENILKADPEIKPALPKYATDRSRYSLYALAFVMITLLLYFFVSFIFPYVIAGMAGKDVTLTTNAAFVFGTLMFVSLSSRIPVVSNLLADYKQRLFKNAQIPDKGLSVFRDLRYGVLDKDSEIFQDTLRVMLSDECCFNIKDSLDEDYFSYDKKTIERRWARLAYLLCCVEQWSTQEPFKRHINSGSLCWQQIRELCLRQLLPAMIQYKSEGNLTDEEKVRLHTLLRRVLIKVYWLITLLLFMSNKSGEAPDIHLKRIGWIVNPEKYFDFSLNQVLFTGATVFMSILVGATFGGLSLYFLTANGFIEATAALGPKEIFRWVVFGIPMFVVPLLLVLYFKRYLSVYDVWNVCQPDQPKIAFSNRPWAVYLAVASICYAITLCLLVVIAAFVELPGEKTVREVIASLGMYTVVAGVTAIYVCYLLDSPSARWGKGFKFYFVNLPSAITQGTFNVLVVGYCLVYFSGIGSFDLTELEQGDKGRLLVYSVTAFLIGISVNLSTRVASKRFDRRAEERQDAAENWLTVFVGSFSKRVQAVRETINSIEVLADSQLFKLIRLGNQVKFERNNNDSFTGKVTALSGNIMTVTFDSRITGSGLRGQVFDFEGSIGAAPDAS